MKLLIWGVSNVGKTTIGRELAKQLNCIFYDIYFIKQSKITIFFFDALKNPAPQNAVLTL